jgi:hypothetical protein
VLESAAQRLHNQVRRIHFIVGLLGVIAFVITGQVMARHVPDIHALSAEVQLMYVSRHIYLLGAALVNLVLGLYLRLNASGWRRVLQQIGSLLILLSVISLILAFITEPTPGIAGRSWRSFSGLIALFAGVMVHTETAFAREPN